LPPPLAIDGIVTCPERERENANAPPAHFNEAHAEQALWQEFRDRGASLNNTLNEVLRIHGGPAWRIFQVHLFSVGFWNFSPPPCLPCSRFS
jgi:hypothetical protein